MVLVDRRGVAVFTEAWERRPWDMLALRCRRAFPGPALFYRAVFRSLTPGRDW
jgi:hypothetical protein